MKNILLALLTFTTLVSCEYHNTADCHQIITVVNNTDRHLYVSGSYDYPDTLAFKYSPNPKLDYAHNKVGAMGKNKVAFADRSCWEAKIAKRAASGVVMFYVFDGETLEKTPWDTIKKNNMYLYRYDLRLEDMEERGWQIVYDGEQKNN